MNDVDIQVCSSLFVYGALGDQEIQRALTGRSFTSIAAFLKDWSMYQDEYNYYFLKPTANYQVKGHILTVNQSELDIFDQWESYPTYAREMCMVYSNDSKSHRVWVYTRRDAHGKQVVDFLMSEEEKKRICDEMGRIMTGKGDESVEN